MTSGDYHDKHGGWVGHVWTAYFVGWLRSVKFKYHSGTEDKHTTLYIDSVLEYGVWSYQN